MTGAAFELDVTVLGGCGRAGLPLAISFADRGLRVGIYDISAEAVARVSRGDLPFQEPQAAEPLRATIGSGALQATVDPAVVGASEAVVVVIGTPVDEHLNPDPESVARALRPCEKHFRDGQLVVLRSTIFPGVTAAVERRLETLGIDVDVAFCPERIAEGQARRDGAPVRAAADFNLSTAASTTVLELAELVWSKIKGPDEPLRLVHDEPFEHDVQRRIPSVDKARDVLGFEATTTLSEMLDEVIPWIRDAIERGAI